MTTRILCNFEGPAVDEAEGRSLTYTNAVVEAASARFGSGGVRFTAATGSVIVGGEVLVLDGAFTAEAWVRRPAGATIRPIFGPDSPTNYLAFTAAGLLQSSYGTTITGVTTASENTYHHVALTRIGNQLRLFLNGNLEATGTNSSGFSLSGRLGQGSGGSGSSDGVWIDGFRLVNGAALYLRSFTPPTEPPTVAYTLPREYSEVATLSVGEIMPLNPSTTLPNQPVVFRFDPQLGTATLTGTTKNIGSPNQPVSRRVILIEEQSGRVVREAWSDPLTGVYTFSELLPQVRYTVIAYDHTGVFRAVIADNLEATL